MKLPQPLAGLPPAYRDAIKKYAAAAVATERERCLEICAAHYTIEGIAQKIAADIRAQEVPL